MFGFGILRWVVDWLLGFGLGLDVGVLYLVLSFGVGWWVVVGGLGWI